MLSGVTSRPECRATLKESHSIGSMTREVGRLRQSRYDWEGTTQSGDIERHPFSSADCGQSSIISLAWAMISPDKVIGKRKAGSRDRWLICAYLFFRWLPLLNK